jgi:hypothetical protein
VSEKKSKIIKFNKSAYEKKIALKKDKEEAKGTQQRKLKRLLQMMLLKRKKSLRL